MSNTYNLDGLLRWRCIGPFRGGRVVAVAGDPSDLGTFYFGACAGGVWKTSDGGTYWENVSDGFFKTGAVGALAVAPSDPSVIYAGMGESTIRIDVSCGDGVYKSTDAGKTWQHMGLADTRVISKIRVHPNNPDLVYVAALGHAFGNNEERGVYRSQDGGKTWDKVLYRSEKAGAIDLTLDQNPRILYAAMWEGQRTFWDIKSGGLDSSLYKSTDGGETWSEITHNKGLPSFGKRFQSLSKGKNQAVLGKVGMVASPAQSGRVWALIEAKEGGLFRSDDYGETWERVSDKGELLMRPWYFTHIVADTQDPNTVYVMNLQMWKSLDGGKTFSELTTPHGDNHELWIDPNNPQRMIQGNDGGACVSYNGGYSWSSIYNQPTAQFYHLAVDTQYPYRVYGTQQDNTSVSVPSRSNEGVIPWRECYCAGTGESGYIAVHPDDPNIVYVGAIGSSPGGGNALQRYDHRTGQIRLITTWPEEMAGSGAGEHKYRFAWTYPIVISPHNAKVLYVAGNQVLRSMDEGNSWQEISPDLTVADPETLKPSGGPINLDAIGAETYATIFSFVESQHEEGVFWAGSDDGLIHVSQDGGKSWQNVTPASVQQYTMISMIEQSPHDPATVYVAATRYKVDDYRPYLYKTSDYGQTWHEISEGIADDHFTRAIREDPHREGLLYVGTEAGLYISFNAGTSWQAFQLNLPITPIYDLLIKNKDLVVGTHGRSFWILDDISPLHQLHDAIYDADAHLFMPGDSYRLLPHIFAGWIGGSPGKNYMANLGDVTAYYEDKSPEGARTLRFLDAGENPPRGVIIAYYLKAQPSEVISLTILDAKGEVVKRFENKLAKEDKGKKKEAKKEEEEKDMLYIPSKTGMNRFIWDMRYQDGVKVAGKDIAAVKPIGPTASPGRYQVQLKVGDTTQNTSFELRKDPRLTTTQAEFDEQFELLIHIRDRLSAANGAINRVRDLRTQLDGWVGRIKGHAQEQTIEGAASTLKEKLSKVEDILIIPDPKTPVDVWGTGRLTTKFGALTDVVGCADYPPTKQSYNVFEKLSGELDEALKRVQELMDGDVVAFNKLIADASVPALVPKS